MCSATRTPLSTLRIRGAPRALFVALAFDQGWGHVARLAEVCRCCTRTIENLAASVGPIGLRAAQLCLGDARLRRLPAPFIRPELRRRLPHSA